MGPSVDIWCLQSWSARLFFYLLLSVSINRCGKPAQVGNSVSSIPCPIVSCLVRHLVIPLRHRPGKNSRDDTVTLSTSSHAAPTRDAGVGCLMMQVPSICTIQELGGANTEMDKSFQLGKAGLRYIDADLTCSNRWTMGSILFLASFAAIMGPLAYLQHLLSAQRLPFTAAYFGSLALTLYFSIGVSTP